MPNVETREYVTSGRRFHKRRQAESKARLVEPTDLAGLTFVEDQTFGVEIELTSPLGAPDETGMVYGQWKWQLIATVIIDTIERAATLPVDKRARKYHEVSDTDRWRVEFDRSAGWEIVSPILQNREGFAELVRVVSALEELVGSTDALEVNYRTGLHITLGSRFDNNLQVQTLVRLTQLLEPGLFTLLCPSRLFHFQDGSYDLSQHNRYCRPLRCQANEPANSILKGVTPPLRYRSVNLCRVARQGRFVEVRLHHGTISYAEVIAWICLWMAVLNRASLPWRHEGSCDAVFPGYDARIDPEQAQAEDLFAQLDRLDVQVDPALRRMLHHRRESGLAGWKALLPRRVDSWLDFWDRPRSEDHWP